MTALSATPTLDSTWRRALPMLALLWALILVLYREPAIQMVGVWWRSNTFAHAFLVLPISLWLAWRMRDHLALLTPQPEPRVLAALFGVAAVWLLADLTMVNSAAQFALVGLLVLAVPAVLGLSVARALMFPLLFMFFAVPFGEFMLQPMMEWTADFVVLGLQLTGIPVYREGLQFVIPTGSWSVIDECSGVRYLIASFMVGSLFAYLNYQSHLRRTVFMAVSLIVPIVANWLRAYLIVMMGHLSGNKLAVGFDHLLYGWVFFGVVIFIMFTIGMRWSEPEVAPAAAPAGSSAAGPVVPGSRFLWVTTAAAAIVLLPHLVSLQLDRLDRAAAEPALQLPADWGPDWVASSDPMAAGWKASFPGASLEARRVYTGKHGQVGVLVAYFRSQTTDRKLVSSLNGVVQLNDRIWNRVDNGRQAVAVGGDALTFTTHDIMGPQLPDLRRRQRLLAWQTYWVDGRFINSDARTKVAGAVSRLQGRGDDGAVVVLFAEGESVEASRASLERFVGANLPALNQLLQRTRDIR